MVTNAKVTKLILKDNKADSVLDQNSKAVVDTQSHISITTIHICAFDFDALHESER
jgi:hypothetical protein